jgi:transcriptional regulator with XRE-family HTH domain
VSISSLDGLIAGRVTLEREARGWSLGELAARSGVSRAMISKIERGDARPTASLLGKLSAAFSLPLSLLFARVEQSSSRVSRAAARTRWRDPASGHTRLAISPPSDAFLQLTEVSLPPRAKVSFPAAAYTFIHQQIWVLQATLRFHEGDEVHVLEPGDCLTLGSPADCTFENAGRKTCRYVVAVAARM